VPGEVGLGSKTGGDNGTGRQTVKKVLRLDFLADFYVLTLMESTLRRIMKIYSSMRVAELKQEPRTRGLRSGGTKSVTAAAARR
jgi:hypothetical protein